MKSVNIIRFWAFAAILSASLACNGVVPPTPTPTPAPTQTPIPIPVIYKQGTLAISYPDAQLADLDNGTIVPKGTLLGGDLLLDPVTSRLKYLKPMTDTILAMAGPAEPNYEVCNSLLDARLPQINIDDLAHGSYLCIYTDEKRISVVSIVSVDKSANGAVQFVFTTWATK